MRTYPHAKINLGLNITERRPDGYHNLETVFMPVPLCDRLDISERQSECDQPKSCNLTITGGAIEGDTQDNLVVKAYRLMAAQYDLPSLDVVLDKQIPTQAGLGGGSSDATFMLRAINDYACLGLTQRQLADIAVKLGADCPCFTIDGPCYAEGIGEKMTPIQLDLSGWWIAIVKPDIAVSTREAFSKVRPRRPEENCRETVALPVDHWRDRLTNDFEESVFALYPEIGRMKERLYSLGATFALMSGSGSSLYALYRDEPQRLDEEFGGCFVWHDRL